MCSFSETTETIKRKLEKAMRHSYIENNISKSVISTEKIALLHSLYVHTDILKPREEQEIITILLVQSALDTHELVPTGKTNQMNQKEIQLSVLAGDYYSGLYYYLLADLENLDLIHILATSIRQINEQKMILFYREAATFDELFETMKKIEALLFVNTADYLGFDNKITEWVEDQLLLYKLEKERTAIENDLPSYMLQFAKQHNMQEQMVPVLFDKLNNLVGKLKDKRSYLPFSIQMKEYLKKQDNDILNHL
ncbi:MAG TPA: heptaprenyl diphosphate synthase component 1 [Pseudogracilibacillus sp.]|nr:heptaprenyl diphosphate synthase component 1 [Pseudogracilibacillus sp.]